MFLLRIDMLVIAFKSGCPSNSGQYTAQKMKFSIKDFFSKCDQIHRKLRIWSYLLKKSLMENFIFLCSGNHLFYVILFHSSIQNSIWHTCHSLLITLSYKFPWALLTFGWLKLASPSFCTYVVVDSSSFDFVTILGFFDTTEFDTTSVAFLWVLLVPP